MHCFMKALTLLSVCTGLALSGTLSVRFAGDLDVEVCSSCEPLRFDWTHFLITFEIDEFPTPTDCYPGCPGHEEDPPEFARYIAIPVTASVVKTGGWKGGKTEDTGPALVTYFDDDFQRGFQIRFESMPYRAYIMLFYRFDLGYEPPEARPKILAMEARGYDSWIGYVGEPREPFFETFYKATLIPEPGTMATLGAGFVTLVLFRRRFGWSR